jgi:TatD DNase family protein
MPFIDFHTHKHQLADGEIIAVNCYAANEMDTANITNYFTLGIHPWDANISQVDMYLDRIMSYTKNSKMLGIGEIGLDKTKGPKIDIQQEVFIKQLKIAAAMQKPVTIHCVKAWDELLAIKALHSDAFLWAVHGFNGSQQLAKQLVDKGFYLSIGSSILNEQSKLQSTLCHIPLNRLFLETDASGVAIKEIYEAVAVKLHITVDSLKQQINKNFSEFYLIEPL